MTKRILYILMAAAAVTGSSCRKYVEVEQPNARTLKYTADFQGLMNNVNTFDVSYSMPLLSADDVDAAGNTVFDTRLTNELANIYTWAAGYYTPEQSDATWGQLYNQIYTCNEVIAHVMSSVNGTDAQKRQVYAEALVQRAYNYLILVNIYAPVYTAAGASTALGVPLKTTPDLFTDLTRPSLQTIYDLIINDVKTALPDLPAVTTNNIHPGKAAANAILARTYLYMQDYAHAAEYAAQALAVQNTLLDLSAYTSSLANYPKRLFNPEVMLSKYAGLPSFITFPMSSELLGYFTTSDLRYSILSRPGNIFSPSFTGRGCYKNMAPSYDNISTGPGVPEMMLIQAEGLARNNQPAEAMQLVNNLRKKRFATADYFALTATTGQEAVKQVLAERRRELFGTGLRWFDQRRLSLEAQWAETETRVLKGTTYTLAPGSNRYVYPIPPNVIQLNPEIKQNER